MPVGRSAKTHGLIKFSLVSSLTWLLIISCGGGGSKGSATPPLALSTQGSLTLPVPTTVASELAKGNYPHPYSGTTTVTLIREASVTNPVKLSVSGLPANVKASFRESSTTSATDELSIQAGYPDSSDPTFSKQVYPAIGSFNLTITASSSGVPDVTTTLTLNLVQEKPDFALSFLTADGTYLDNVTDISLLGGTTVTKTLAAYDVNYSQFNVSGPVSLKVQGAPLALTTALEANTVSLDDTHTIAFTAQPGLLAGTYAFTITASFNGLIRILPVVITYSPSPFFIQPLFQGSAPVSVVQGGTITFPLYLGHNDAFFGTKEPVDGADPNYVGDTLLSASGLPAGLTVSFGLTNDLTNPTGLASVPLLIKAATGVAPGTYNITLQATRNYPASSPIQAPPITLPVQVTAGATPTSWIQAVEWGQTVVKPGLPLVAGKPALLRVQLMADQPGLNTALTATLLDGTSYSLQGPATVPTAVVEGDLPTAGMPSASTYTVLLPASAIQTGMQVTIRAGNLNPTIVTPVVRPGPTLAVTVVPIIHAGLLPVLPPDSAMSQQLLAFWPMQTVTLTHRAPYTTSTVIPAPNADSTLDHSSDGWSQILSELAALQIVDNPGTYFYGFFNLNLPASYKGSSVVGLSYMGDHVGLGIDETTAQGFHNDDPTLDNSATIMVHEMGHAAFNLNHAPAGGAGQPQLNYPYAGGSIGTWGFNPFSQVIFDPARVFDIMSYANHPHWVSDWDYLAAMGWQGGKQGSTGPLNAFRTGIVNSDQWVVSGWIDPTGQAHLSPLVRTSCAPKPPSPGEFRLAIQTSSGNLAIPFSATQLPDLPAGYRHFAFTLPTAGDVTSLEVISGTHHFHRTSSRAFVLRQQALEANTQTGSYVVQEERGHLHLAWDVSRHPWVNVIHEGAQRTTLALHLTGGTADLSLDGLPTGGRFLVHYSDGLNAVVRGIER